MGATGEKVREHVQNWQHTRNVMEEAVRGLSKAKNDFARVGEDDLVVACGQVLRMANQAIEERWTR